MQTHEEKALPALHPSNHGFTWTPVHGFDSAVYQSFPTGLAQTFCQVEFGGRKLRLWMPRERFLLT
jgi:hypothetical protein